MNDIERLLHDLDQAPPADLLDDTTYAAGATDHAVLADSPVGPVWVARFLTGRRRPNPVFSNTCDTR